MSTGRRWGEGDVVISRALLRRVLVALERSQTKSGHLAQRVDTEHLGYCGWRSESPLCVDHRGLVSEIRAATQPALFAAEAAR